MANLLSFIIDPEDDDALLVPQLGRAVREPLPASAAPHPPQLPPAGARASTGALGSWALQDDDDGGEVRAGAAGRRAGCVRCWWFGVFAVHDGVEPRSSSSSSSRQLHMQPHLTKPPAPASLFTRRMLWPPTHVCPRALQRKRSSRLSAKSARRSGYLDGDVPYPGGYSSGSRRGSSGTVAAAAGGPLIQGVPAEALLQVCRFC